MTMKIVTSHRALEHSLQSAESETIATHFFAWKSKTEISAPCARSMEAHFLYPFPNILFTNQSSDAEQEFQKPLLCNIKGQGHWRQLCFSGKVVGEWGIFQAQMLIQPLRTEWLNAKHQVQKRLEVGCHMQLASIPWNQQMNRALIDINIITTAAGRLAKINNDTAGASEKPPSAPGGAVLWSGINICLPECSCQGSLWDGPAQPHGPWAICLQWTCALLDCSKRNIFCGLTIAHKDSCWGLGRTPAGYSKIRTRNDVSFQDALFSCTTVPLLLRIIHYFIQSVLPAPNSLFCTAAAIQR